MTLTIDFIANSFKQFNDEYFNGELNTPVFEIMSTKNLLGQCCWKPTFRIRISNYYRRSEKEYQNTILHEMIHLFIRQKGIKDTRTHHGRVFYKYADFINGYGWNIARTDSVAGVGVDEKYKTTYHMIAFKDDKGRYFLFRYNPDKYTYYVHKLARYKHHYQEPIWFTSKDDKKYGHYSACRNSVRGFFITEREYSSLKQLYAVRKAV